MKGRVFVGLSGGVDSAVSAALLQKRGYDVTGVFIKIWQPEFIECTWREDRLDAMRVAAKLGIPFLELDLSAEYREEVVQDMLDAYTAGRTPNPDVLCNEKIKFGHFYRWAREKGAEYVATGHYARVHHGDDGAKLMRGIDSSKDQSYFLYRLGQGELIHTLFPIGELHKSEVRSLAGSLDLPVAEKPDSQGLCFVGDVTMPEFLSRYISLRAGAVKNTAGVRIGTHDGVALYTIGQRHGFTVDSPPSEPLYVTAIRSSENEIVVSNQRRDAATQSALLDGVHFIRKPLPDEKLSVQTRYRETPVAVKLHGGRVMFEEPLVVSSGQSAVVYSGDECLGGGIMTV